MPPDSFSGGCACGAVRYLCSAAPLTMLNCHCRACQRASGGGSAAAVIVPGAALVITGEPRYYLSLADSGHQVKRGFCAACGSPLFSSNQTRPAFLAVKAASLDDPSWFKPTVDIWTESAQPWDVMDPATTKMPRQRR